MTPYVDPLQQPNTQSRITLDILKEKVTPKSVFFLSSPIESLY